MNEWLRYLFVDMNSYFASAEQHLRPELRGLPVAVVPVMADSTCCIAASYEAKAFGISTGTSVAEAKEKCRGLRLIEARPELYIELHHRIVAVVESCLPVSAVLSIDEMVCRLRGPDREPDAAVALAQQIKQTIQTKIGPALRSSIGIAPNRLLAKAAADMHKPDGLTVIGRQELPQRLYELGLRDLCGIGPRMQARLKDHGIETVEQLCRASEDRLCRLWGSRVLGSAWWRKLRGEDVPEPPTQRRTLGHSHVLPPELRRDELARRVVIRLVHKAAVRLRHIRYRARSFSVQISFLGGRSWHQGCRIPAAQDTLTFLRAANELWERKPGGRPLKVGIVLGDLVAEKNTAGWLYDGDRQQHDLARAMDRVNQRFGAHAVYFGGMYDMQDRAPTRIAFTQIPDLAVQG